ncbi:MAG: hypothetical protein J2P33_24190, partial [Actinobacteria bacterium]|nr:hypothetical protein [Actinomycetota bacterium]
MTGTGSAGPGGPASSREPVDSAWELHGLALSRGEVDRSTINRNDPAWIEAAWADPRTRVLVLTGGAAGPQPGPPGGQAPVRFSEAGAALVLVPAAHAPDGLRFLLGVDEGGTTFFGVALPPGERAQAEAITAQGAGGGTAGSGADGAAGGAAGGGVPAGSGPARAAGGAAGSGVPAGEARLAGLREAGPLLDDRDAGLMTHAVALANWHASHTHCPR